MNRNAYIITSLLVVLLAALCGCSSTPPASETKKAAPQAQRIQGKAQVMVDTTGDTDLNAGGPSVYLWEGKFRYRLFSRRQSELVNGNQYIVEGVNAQKVIDEIGDPAQGKGGYPLQTSCERAVKTAWPGMSFEEVDLKASILRARIARYPARPIILVTKVLAVKPTEGGAASEEQKKDAAEKSLPIVVVPAEKQSALLVEGSTTQTAPLFEPNGGTARCKVVISSEGKIYELETGAQLCEMVPWSKFRYQPTLQKGKPVRVRTEVEIKFEARK